MGVVGNTPAGDVLDAEVSPVAICQLFLCVGRPDWSELEVGEAAGE